MSNNFQDTLIKSYKQRNPNKTIGQIAKALSISVHKVASVLGGVR